MSEGQLDLDTYLSQVCPWSFPFFFLALQLPLLLSWCCLEAVKLQPAASRSCPSCCLPSCSSAPSKQAPLIAARRLAVLGHGLPATGVDRAPSLSSPPILLPLRPPGTFQPRVLLCSVASTKQLAPGGRQAWLYIGYLLLLLQCCCRLVNRQGCVSPFLIICAWCMLLLSISFFSFVQHTKLSHWLSTGISISFFFLNFLDPDETTEFREIHEIPAEFFCTLAVKKYACQLRGFLFYGVYIWLPKFFL